MFVDKSVPAPTELSAGTWVTVDGNDVSLLAGANTAAARVWQILKRQQLDPIAPPEVRAEVEAILSAPGIDDRTVDLTDLPFVTIDNADSRDLDQALYIEAADHGWLLRYALADASYYVRPGTALFDRALERGATFYLPGLAVPMLPEELSEGLVSLNPDVRRRALTFEIGVAPDGAVISVDVVRCVIRSRAKLSYEGVQQWFDTGAAPWATDEIAASLRGLRELGEARIARARARGVIEFTRREPIVTYSADRLRFEVESRTRYDVERWNEQVSLLCNMKGAELLTRLRHSASIFRVHEAPHERTLADLKQTLAELVRLHDLDPSWGWDGAESLADYLPRLPSDARTSRVRAAVERQVRLTNRSSSFSAQVAPHYALGVDSYARFTSPMREVVGIFTHKEALEGLGLEPASSVEGDSALSELVIDAANRSRALQRRLEKEVGLLAIEDLFRADLDLPPAARPVRVGTIVGLRATRIYVALDEFPLDIKLYPEDLEAEHDCEYLLEGAAMRPNKPRAPMLRIGDGIGLRVREWDAGARRFRFGLDLSASAGTANRAG